MNIEALKALLDLINDTKQSEPPVYKKSNPMIGKECIVRTYSAGVYFGTLETLDGMQATISNARRMWQWRTVEGIELNALAKHGIDQSGSRIAEASPLVLVTECVEVIPCSTKSAKSISEAKNAIK